MCGMQKIKVYVWKIKKTHYQKQISQVAEWLVTIFPFIELQTKSSNLFHVSVYFDSCLSQSVELIPSNLVHGVKGKD